MKASPGIVYIELIDKDNTPVVINKVNTKILKGKVIAVGQSLTTNFGTVLNPDWYAQVGNIVYFLSYEGDYDNTMVNNKKMYFVKFEDLRGIDEN